MVSEAGEAGVAVPPAGEMASHEPPDVVVALAVKESEPAPELETRICCVKEAAPWFALKLTFCAPTARLAGVADCTVNVTATATVAGVALGTLMEMVPWNVPAARPDGSAATCKLAGKVPAEGVTESQLAPADAVKASPVIEEERLSVC